MAKNRQEWKDKRRKERQAKERTRWLDPAFADANQASLQQLNKRTKAWQTK